MAVLSVEPVPENSGGKLSTTSREYTRCFLVHVSSRYDEASVALNAGGLPDRDEPHPDDADALCNQLRPAAHDAEGLWWMIYADYATPTQSTPRADPLDDPVRVSWGSWSYTEALTKDRNGAAVDNSAGEPFDPPAEIERRAPLVTIVRNEATYDPATADDYRDSVNSDVTTIAGLAVTARQAMCLEYSAETAVRNGTGYFVVTYQIAFKAATWDRVILNTGMKTLNKVRVFEFDTAGALTEIESQVPMLLAANGTQLAWNGTPTYETFQVNAQKAFAALDLNI